MHKLSLFILWPVTAATWLAWFSTALAAKSDKPGLLTACVLLTCLVVAVQHWNEEWPDV